MFNHSTNMCGKDEKFGEAVIPKDSEDIPLEEVIQVNIPIEWEGKISEDELADQIVAALINHEEDRYITVAGVRAKLTFACNGDIFFTPDDIPATEKIIHISIPHEWHNHVSVPDLEEMIDDVYDENLSVNPQLTFNGVTAEYHKCSHGYVWFIPLYRMDEYETTILCKNHV